MEVTLQEACEEIVTAISRNAEASSHAAPAEAVQYADAAQKLVSALASLAVTGAIEIS